MYSVNAHFMWTRNYEFLVLKETGCDGCPTREEFEVNSVSGAKIGGLAYLFGMHPIREVLSTTWDGYVQTYLWPTELFAIQSGTRSVWLYAFYLVGVGVVLLGPARELLAVILLLANVVPFALALGIDARIGIQTAPFVALLLAYGLWWVAGRGIRAVETALAQGRQAAFSEEHVRLGSPVRSMTPQGGNS